MVVYHPCTFAATIVGPKAIKKARKRWESIVLRLNNRYLRSLQLNWLYCVGITTLIELVV
jgi:hypothetical protein